MTTLIYIIISVFFALGAVAFTHNMIFVQYPRHREELFKTFRPGKWKKLEEKRNRERKNGNKPIAILRTDKKGVVIVWAKSKKIAQIKYKTYLDKNPNKQPKEIFTQRKYK